VGSHSYGVQWPVAAGDSDDQRGASRSPSRGRHAAASGRRRTSGLSYVPLSFRLASVTSWYRALICAALGACTAMLFLFQYRFRHAEAAAAATVFNLVTPTLAATKAPIVWFGLATPHAFGLLITPDCSATLLLVPLLLLGMALVVPVRLPLRRVLGALGCAATLLVAGNLLRIGAIALAVRIAGPGIGYEVGHLVIGSAISVVVIGTSLILMTLIITSRRGRTQPAGKESRG
jgi:exosortase/archaeosortase family protein